MKDLFGNEIEPEPARLKRNETARGYAGQPGRGPAGETCKTCVHAYYHKTAKRYWKCDLVKATCGPGTDIRLKSPACQFWKTKV